MKIDMSKMGAVFMMLRHVATLSHVEHLITKSFARHSALGSFYEDIIGLADNFAEACQGYCGERIKCSLPKEHLALTAKAEEWIPIVCKKIEDLQKEVDDSAISNIMDEIRARFYKLSDNISRD